MDPITVSLAAVSVSSALAFRIGGFIAELRAAGDEFEDMIRHLRYTEETVNRLDPILRDPTLPKQLSEEYTRELRRAQNDLEDIGLAVRKITEKLRERTFWTRTKTKAVLANGEMARLVNLLQFFNQNISNLIAAHSGRVLSLIHGGVQQVVHNTNFQSRAISMDVGVRYGQPAINSLQFDAWDPSPRPSSIHSLAGRGGPGGVNAGGGPQYGGNQGGYGTGRNTFAGSAYAPNTYGAPFDGPPPCGYGAGGVGGGVLWGESVGGALSPPPTYGATLGAPQHDMRRMASTRALSDRFTNGNLLQKEEWD